MALPFIGLIQGTTLPRFHSEEFAQSERIRQFAFNVLMRPDDRATKSRCQSFTGNPLGTDAGITALMSRADGSVSDLRNATI